MGELLSEKSSITPEVLAWFEGKGITSSTAFQFAVEVADDGAICFPYRDGTKRRYGVPSGTRSFRWDKGVAPCLYNLGESHKRTLFLVEGETDTMRLWQALNDAGTEDVGVVGLPGIETWDDSMAEDLKHAERIFVILDNDADYMVQGRVDHAWAQMRLALGNRARRVHLPNGINDICDFFQTYDLDGLRALVAREPAPGESRFKVLDLTADPPPVHWVIEDMICGGDIHMLIGEPSIGKSWLTMGMAVAVAGGAPFLGRSVEQGRVLYVDEENPEDLIYGRLHKLGLTPAIAKNIRYLSNLGIRLDKQADDLVTEALDYDPTLIILDSLTRFHTEDENNAGAISALFNDALMPLARKTGAAVVLIHHANKTDSNSSYKRSRGSGDITAGADCGYDVRAVAERTVAVSNYKSRRAAQQDTFFVTIQDVEDRVELIGGESQHIPF